MQELPSNESPVMNRSAEALAAICTAPFSARIEKPWGWETHWTPPNLPYVGKILHIFTGARLSLQVHEDKTETWILLSGEAATIWESEAGEMIETQLVPGQGYTCVAGQQHRLVGITECDILEVSTPERGTTWRLEDDYSRPHETPAQRSTERAWASRPS